MTAGMIVFFRISLTIVFKFSEPCPDICATVLYDFLEVAGSSMLEKYGRQYQKLLLVICKEYFPRLRKVILKLFFDWVQNIDSDLTLGFVCHPITP